jgi:hypothetical protein
LICFIAAAAGTSFFRQVSRQSVVMVIPSSRALATAAPTDRPVQAQLNQVPVHPHQAAARVVRFWANQLQGS